MFDKIKEIAAKNMENLSGAADGNPVSLSGAANTLTATLKSKADGAIDSLKEFSIMSKVKDFTAASVSTVEEIDQFLLNSRSQYEINNFSVNATAGVTAGMTLNIHFMKNSGAKDLAQERSKYLMVKNSNTGSEIKITRISVADKVTAKVKDPKDGSILTFDTKTGAIIDPAP